MENRIDIEIVVSIAAVLVLFSLVLSTVALRRNVDRDARLGLLWLFAANLAFVLGTGALLLAPALPFWLSAGGVILGAHVGLLCGYCALTAGLGRAPPVRRLVGVAVLTSARGSFEHHLDRFPALRSQLAGAGPASAVRGAGPLRQRARSRVAGRVLLVGDASGYVDALTGEGISMGLAQARAAVAAIAADDPQRYERQWRAITWRYRLLTAGLLHATRLPPVRRGLVPAAERLPAVFSAAVNTLARPA